MDFEWEERKPQTPVWIHMIAGSLAGISEHVLMLPFDSLKTHSQIQTQKNKYLEIAKKIYQIGGLQQFYRGASMIALGCGPAHACYFTIYELLKNKLQVDNENINFIMHGMTGLSAVVLHDLIINPFDVIKQRQQLLATTKISEIIKDIVTKEGYFQFFRSLPITLFMNMPWHFVHVGFNETIKRLYCEDKEHTFSTYFICAALSAAIASTCTIPLDNIKTRLQVQKCLDPTYKSTAKLATSLPKPRKEFSTLNVTNCEYVCQNNSCVKYNGILHTIRLIVHEEGLKGFGKGVIPRIISTAPSSAVSWSTYEIIKRSLIQQQPKLI